VVLFHAGCIRGGFIGVNIFFVLSGFLITRLFIAEFDLTGAISIRNFLIRRFLRLAPALWVCVGIYLLVAWKLDPPQIHALDLRCALTALAYMTDFRLRSRDFFAHSWSLAVEEQFYLLWSLGILATVALAPCRAAAILGAGALVVYLGRAALVLTGMSMLRIHIEFETRADELLLGCATAFVLAQASFQIRASAIFHAHRYLGLVFLAALVGLGLVVRPITPEEFLLWIPVVALLSAALVTDLTLNSGAGAAAFWRGDRSPTLERSPTVSTFGTILCTISYAIAASRTHGPTCGFRLWLALCVRPSHTVTSRLPRCA
jgi:peptidoglycan/LPS O-acetylase OafA/YrhL